MKKLTCLLLICALMCGFSCVPTLSADASDAATYQEYRAQAAALETSAFPDPDASYTVVTDGDYEYRVYDGFAVLSECKNTDIVEAVIPETVNDLPVVGLVESPFSYCHKLTSITLPDSFEHFSWYHLIENVTTIGGSDEEYLPSVSKIIVSETNPYYTVADGMLYTKDMKTLVGCPPTLGVTELNIPEQTDTIGDYAFFACMDLESAIIPENIEHINNNAFTACMNLKTAEIPKSMTYLPGDMFFYCTSLSKVSFKGELEKIGYGAFHECTALTDFVIPDTVTAIGWQAFSGAGCVETVNGLQYVQDWLVGCEEDTDSAVIRKETIGIAEMSLFAIKGLKTIEVPSSVEKIGAYWCTGFPSGELSVLHYRASRIPENTLSAARSCSDIYIYDPFCDIFDSEKTIAPIYRYYTEEQSSDSLLTVETETEGDIVIHGYSGSTAQEYAEKYNRKFERIKPSGDVNGDGELNISDVVLLQKWLLAIPDTHLADWKAADLCEDNRLDVFDLCLMKRELLSGKSSSENKSYSFSAQYIRTNGSIPDKQYPYTLPISDRSALDDYISENRSIYDFSSRDVVYSDTTVGFVDAVGKYTDEWFADNQLLIVVLEEPSGSFRHEITELNADSVIIDRLIPETYTADMAAWHLLIEIDKSSVLSDDIRVILNDVEQH